VAAQRYGSVGSWQLERSLRGAGGDSARGGVSLLSFRRALLLLQVEHLRRETFDLLLQVLQCVGARGDGRGIDTQGGGDHKGLLQEHGAHDVVLLGATMGIGSVASWRSEGTRRHSLRNNGAQDRV
jgi:hypothetical protein